MAIFKDIPRFDDTGITEYYRVNDGKVVKLSSDYDSLDDKPTINGVTIEGDLTTELLNIPVGNIEELRTNIKDNLVNAINELHLDAENFSQAITEKVNGIVSFTIKWVEELPSEDKAEQNTVYLVPKTSMIEEDNYCEEFLYTDHGWEKIGDTKVDLSSYATREEMQAYADLGKLFPTITTPSDGSIYCVNDGEMTANTFYQIPIGVQVGYRDNSGQAVIFEGTINNSVYINQFRAVSFFSLKLNGDNYGTLLTLDGNPSRVYGAGFASSHTGWTSSLAEAGRFGECYGYVKFTNGLNTLPTDYSSFDTGYLTGNAGYQINQKLQAADNKIGNLNNLTTENKDNLVEAINEVKESAGDIKMLHLNASQELDLSDCVAGHTYMWAPNYDGINHGYYLNIRIGTRTVQLAYANGPFYLPLMMFTMPDTITTTLEEFINANASSQYQLTGCYIHCAGPTQWDDSTNQYLLAANKRCRIFIQNRTLKLSNWERNELGNLLPSKGGSVSVRGNVTFYSSSSIEWDGTPTRDNQLTTKKYVDDAIQTGISSIDDNIYRIVLTTNTRTNTGNGSSNLNATDRQAYADWLTWYQSKLGTPTVLEFYCTGNSFGAPSGTHKHLLGRIEFNGGAFTANKDISVTGIYAYNANGSTMDTIAGRVGDPVYTIYVTRVYFRTDIDANGNYIPHSSFNGTFTTCPSTFGDVDYQNSRIDLRTWLNTVAYTPTSDYNAATKKYVDDSITSAIGDIVSFGVELVDELPTENISSSTVYMVPAAEASDQNIREEYLYTEHGWEMVGSTQINLENYYATEDEVLNILYPQTEPDINIDIDGFDVLTYIENTDTAYFDTQLCIKGGNTYKAEIKMSITDPANSGEGYREGWVFGCYEYGGWRAGIETGDGSSSYWDTSGGFTYDPQELIIDQPVLAQSEINWLDDWSTPIGLFVQLEGSEYNPERRFLGKIYYCHIWENNVLVRSLIPVRHKESGEIGLYDTVNKAFLTSPNPGLVGGAING